MNQNGLGGMAVEYITSASFEPGEVITDSFFTRNRGLRIPYALCH